MKKELISVVFLLFSWAAYSQVGINNNDPKATLDITAKTTDGSKAEGLIPPRLTGDQIKAADTRYTVPQKGVIIYATAAVGTPSVKTANITAEGYYYFDGNIWQKVGVGNNLYAGSTSITLNGNSFERAALTGDVSAAANNNTTNIANGAVTTDKIANNAITLAKLPAGASASTFLRGDGTWVTPTDTNLYNSNGTLSGSRTVTIGSNTLTFLGTSGGVSVQSAASQGKITLRGGSASQAGFVEIFKGDGSTRLGYIGYDNTNMSYNAENSAVHVFNTTIRTTRVEGASDIRFKKDIHKIDDATGKLRQLNGYTYTWKKKNDFPGQVLGEGKDMGVIAQEVEKVFPDAVSTNKEGYKSVNYNALIPVLIEALKEADEKIRKLQQRFDRLEATHH